MKKTIAAVMAMLIMSTACGGGKEQGAAGGGGASGGGGETRSETEFAGLELSPDYTWHGSYMAASHSSFICDDCHFIESGAARGVDSRKICYICHVSDYHGAEQPQHSETVIGLRCNACHYSDSFRSHARIAHNGYHALITRNCEKCHVGRYPADHVSTGRVGGCDGCHQYPNWRGADFAHSYTTGCADCHSGSAPAGHYGPNCQDCHSYGDWKNASMAHTFTSNCSRCHSGLAPANHYGSTCENCHAYSDWFNAIAPAHTYTSGCSSCHANRAPANHYGSTCESCHTYNNWLNATFVHNYSSGCVNCHADRKPGKHSAAVNSCEACHGYPSWSGSHGSISSGCKTCHSRHYGGYECEWCHNRGISWSREHDRYDSRSCPACHSSGTPGEDDLID